MANVDMAKTEPRATPFPPKPAEDDEVFHVDPSVKARRREMIIVAVARTIILGLGLVGWQWVSDNLISEFWISSPILVAKAFVRDWSSGVLFHNLASTIRVGILGFTAGALVGMTIGIVFGANRITARIFDPIVVAFYSIPRVALIPLFILWFGIGLQTQVLYTALLVFFPVFMNTYSGARDVDQDLIDVIRVMGATRADTIRKILIPSALVWLFAGLRISVPYALVGAVVAEMFTSNVGLGYLISLYANSFDTAGLFAVLGVTTALGLLLNMSVAWLGRRLMRWKASPA